jgi:thymidylate synthase
MEKGNTMFISEYEKQYIKALRKIYLEGFEDGVNERTGISTKRLPGIVIQVDVEKEFPILKSKFVAAKTAQREIEWIWKQGSSNINDLNAHIWDSWADEDGSIGKAYGYQINKPVRIYLDNLKKTKESLREYTTQAHYIIEYLKENPNGRWGVVTLWNTADLAEMNLVPCCHTSTWNLDGGRLNCILDQRSGDMPYGVPFNTTQYAELMIMLAKALSTPEKEVKPGLLTHVIADAHIYANQMRGVQLQLYYYDIMHKTSLGYDYAAHMLAKHACEDFSELCNTADELLIRADEALSSSPEFVINAENPYDFFSYTADECYVDDYLNMGKIDFGAVAV